MPTEKNTKSERVLYFDHIRYLMVLLVVVVHAACGYSYFMPHWAVNDVNSAFFNYLLLFLNIFLMPILFFIAGFFALPSLCARGVSGFIKAKFIRLGIPLLLGVLFFKPIENFIFYYSRDLGSHDVLHQFAINIHSAATFRSGLLTTKLQFNHGYFCFF